MCFNFFNFFFIFQFSIIFFVCPEVTLPFPKLMLIGSDLHLSITDFSFRVIKITSFLQEFYCVILILIGAIGYLRIIFSHGILYRGKWKFLPLWPNIEVKLATIVISKFYNFLLLPFMFSSVSKDWTSEILFKTKLKRAEGDNIFLKRTKKMIFNEF